MRKTEKKRHSTPKNTMTGRLLYWLGFMILGAAVMAQEHPVSGKVSNAAGETLPGVNIYEKGTITGVTSDLDGNYSIQVSGPDAIIVFSFVGYRTEEISLNGRSVINVELATELRTMDEFVVVGYGTMRRSDLTGSVGSVTGETLTEMSSASIGLALQGRTAGVQVQQNTGAPGAGLQIRIRGNNSIKGSNEPLWVVDGFPVSGPGALNLADIESVDILKDASATAIYGSRGANGVIIVTTKQGDSGPTRVFYEGRYGVQSVIKKFDLLNAEEYMTLMNIQQQNDFGSRYFSQNDFENIGKETDWQDLIFQAAPIHDHSIRITGGDRKTRFAVSGSYFDQNGLIQNSGYRRIALRTNLDHDINDIFNVTVNATLSRADRDVQDDAGGQRAGNLLHATIAAPPTIGPYLENGAYRRLNDEYPFSATGFVNPVSWVNEKSQNWYMNRTMANLALNIRPLSGLTIRLSGNVLNNDYRWDRYYTSRYQDSSGSAGIETTQTLELSSNNIITYEKRVGGHNFTVMGGSTYEQYTHTPFRVAGDGFIHDILETYDIGSATIIGVPHSSYTHWRILSFLGRFNYSYEGKYLLTLNFRSDGSSRYSAGNKWGYFPSGAFAWRVSEEDFMQNIDMLSNLKLRLGYGVTGSTAISPYSTVSLLSSETAVWDKQLFPGFDPRDTYPGDLRWETTEQLNIGLDFGLFNERIQFVADYYIKNTRDLLNDVQLPSSSGYNSTVQNIGRMQNKGLELHLEAVVVDNASLRWDVTSNISFNRSKVVELYGGQDITGSWYSMAWLGDYINLIREGQPFGVFYGYLEEGYDDNGRIIYRDLDDDGLITERDKTYIGDPNPDFIYSLTSSLKYRNFTFSFFLQGVYGNDILSLSMGTVNYDYGWGLNTFSEVLYDHWSRDNPEAKYPIISAGNNYRMSERFVYDGSYLRLRNIELGYDIPLERLGIRSTRKSQIYVSAQNLLTITTYPWWDPDVNSRGGSSSINQGIDHFTYPSAKSITFGARFEF